MDPCGGPDVETLVGLIFLKDGFTFLYSYIVIMFLVFFSNSEVETSTLYKMHEISVPNICARCPITPVPTRPPPENVKKAIEMKGKGNIKK